MKELNQSHFNAKLFPTSFHMNQSVYLKDIVNLEVNLYGIYSLIESKS